MDKLQEGVTVEENLKNRIRYLENELAVIKEKVKVLSNMAPLTIKIDTYTQGLAKDIEKYIDNIKGIGTFL